MSGHRHNSSADTQNQGNTLGDKACVRQSKLYRQHESGNGMKDILGKSHLGWEVDRQEGAYKGKPVFDHNAPNSVTNQGSDPRYAAQDMKNKFSQSSTGNSYERQPSFEKNPPIRSKYEEQGGYRDDDRSLSKYQSKVGSSAQTRQPVYQNDENSFRSERNRHDVPSVANTDYRSMKAASSGYVPSRSSYGGGGGSSYEAEEDYRQPPVGARSRGEYGGRTSQAPYESSGHDDYGVSSGTYVGSKSKKPENYYVNESTVYGSSSGNGAGGKGNQSTRPW